MSERLDKIKIGDVIRVFTYAGTRLNGHAKIPNIVEESRFLEHIDEPLNPNEDGLKFIGVYMGTRSMIVANTDALKKQTEPYAQFQVLSQNQPERDWNWGRPNSNDPDLVIPERLVRRYQILEPSYSSPVLSLEKLAEIESSKSS